jgi:hypothetical protein
MRGRPFDVGFLFLIGTIATCLHPTPSLADERGPLWGLAERVCASGTTPPAVNSEDFPLHEIGAADQPIRLIQEAELVEGRQRVRGILMPLAQCPDNKPLASGTVHLIFGMAERGEGHSFLTSPAGDLISVVHAALDESNKVAFKRLEIDDAVRERFKTEKTFWLAKLANPAR